MLKIKTAGETTFEYPVTVMWPEKTGQVKKTFGGVFKLLSQPDSDALMERVQNYNKALVKELRESADTGSEEEVPAKKIKDVVREACEEVLRGWDNKLADENGEPLEFNDAQKQAVLNNPILRNSIWAAYQEASSGQKARLGN